MTQSELPKISSSSPRGERSIMKVEGKRDQEDGGGNDPSKLPKISSSSPRGERSIMKVESKPVQEDDGGRVPDITQSELPKMSEEVEDIPVTRPRYDPVSGRTICACGRFCDDDDKYDDYENFGIYFSAEGRYYGENLAMVVPSFVWPFVDEMAAKSDDKTLVVSNITREIRKDEDFIKLFEPFGEVKSAKLAPADEDGTVLGAVGFVTFVSKEDAQRAMETLNAYGPRGWDERTLTLDWASIFKKSKSS